MARSPLESRTVRLSCPLPLAWESGHEYVLTAVRRALDAGVHLTLAVADDGPEHERVRFTTHDLDLVDVVTSPTAGGDVTLVTPLVAAGAPTRLPTGPTVVTDVGRLPELAAGRDDVRIVAPRDPAALAAAIIELAGRTT